jgi:hypothetical protein
MGYAADANGPDPARPGGAAAAAHRRHRAAGDQAHRIELNLDRAQGGHAARRRRRRIDFNDPDTYNNATSLTVYDAKGQEVALTYYFQKAGDRHLERLRHRQRQPWAGTAPPAAADHDHLRRRRQRAHRPPAGAAHRCRSTSRPPPTRRRRRRCRSPA